MSSWERRTRSRRTTVDKPLSDVDHHDVEVGGRGGRHHAARIAILTGDVVDDEVALVGRARRPRSPKEKRSEGALAAADAAAERNAQGRSRRGPAACGCAGRVCVVSRTRIGDIVADVGLGPAGEREEAHGFASAFRRMAEAPDRGRLVRVAGAARGVDHEVETSLGGRRRERLAGHDREGRLNRIERSRASCTSAALSSSSERTITGRLASATASQSSRMAAPSKRSGREVLIVDASARLETSEAARC